MTELSEFEKKLQDKWEAWADGAQGQIVRRIPNLQKEIVAIIFRAGADAAAQITLSMIDVEIANLANSAPSPEAIKT